MSQPSLHIIAEPAHVADITCFQCNELPEARDNWDVATAHAEANPGHIVTVHIEQTAMLIYGEVKPANAPGWLAFNMPEQRQS